MPPLPHPPKVIRDTGVVRPTLPLPRPTLPPIPKPVDSSSWQESKEWLRSHVFCYPTNGETKQVPAKIYGKIALEEGGLRGGVGGYRFALAVRRTLPSTRLEGWVLASLSVRRNVCIVDSEKDAMRVGESLWADGECRKALAKKTLDELLSILPKWVEPWLKAINKVGTWIDPEPFKRLLL